MTTLRTPCVFLLSVFSSLVVATLLCSDASAQKRPKSLDTSSTVQETRRVVHHPAGSHAPATEARTGLLKIAPALDGVTISLDGKPAKVTADKAENQLQLDNIAPGKHTITYDHPDYVILEKVITVRGGQEYLWTPPLKPATVALSVTTEPGTKVYVDDVPRGETLPNGTLKLDDVKIGSHQIKLVKDTFEEFHQTAEFVFEKPVQISARLVPLPSSAEFSEFFDINLNRWTKPAAGWSLKDGRLWLASSPEPVYPTGINYRECTMAFYLRLKNGGGAAWIVRMKDPKDYYLFVLNGPQGAFPGYFNTYVVRDGKLDLTNPDTSVPVIATIKAGGEYQIEVHATGDVISHTITPSDTGKSEPLGVFKDPNNTFSYGGIGFRTVGAEQFSVDDLFVQPK